MKLNSNNIALAFSVILAGNANTGGAQAQPQSVSAASTAAAKTATDIPVIPVEEFFRNAERSAYQISPDGMHYSYLAPYESRKNIFVENLHNGEVKRLTSQTDRDIAGYFWANDNQLVYMRDDGGNENWYLVMTDVNSGEERPLTKMEGVRSQIIDQLPDHPNEMIVGLNKRNPQVFDAYRLDLNSGELTMIAENPGNITSWMTDHEGILRVATTTDGVNASILYRENENKAWDTVYTSNFKESIDPSIFTEDNKNVYAMSNIGRDKQAAVVFDIANGKEIREVFRHPTNDVSGLSYSRKRKMLTTVSFTTDKTDYHFFDPESEMMYREVKDRLRDYEISFTSGTREEDKFIVRTYSDRSMGAYYIFDKNTRELRHIADVSPWIKEEQMSFMKPIKFLARDGLEIHGYLTLPAAVKDHKNLPVVVNVHGGPWARDHWGFNPEVQFLANRGYAVLQVNFRGSTGYGRRFWEASFGQWGITMQDDIQDGAQWLINQGIADPKRIAIYGGSYGGYATLQGLVKTPDFYACGVDYVGVSNLFTFMKGIPPYWAPYLKMMYEMVGDPENERDSLRMTKTSPALNADKITKPLFIAQGANDPRVVQSESDQMVAAMKKRGVEVQYMVKTDEGHGFRNEENKFDFYRAMQNFLYQHIGGRK